MPVIRHVNLPLSRNKETIGLALSTRCLLLPKGQGAPWVDMVLLTCAGAVYVERRHSGTPPREDVFEAVMAGASHAEHGMVSGAGCVSWGCYSGGSAVDALIGYLNPVGVREGALKRVRPLLPLLHQLDCAVNVSGLACLLEVSAGHMLVDICRRPEVEGCVCWGIHAEMS